MHKNVIILKSVSGAGKNFFSDILCKNVGYIAVSADDYFTDIQGNYNFDAAKIGNAHLQCRERFMEALKEPEAKNIIVNNTNTKSFDWKFYDDEAKKFGAHVIHLVVENRHGGIDSHNVPEATLQKQESNIRNSLKLR